MNRFQHKDLTVAAFCKAENVSQASFYHWRQRLQNESADQPDESTAAPVKFLPVSLATTASKGASLIGNQSNNPDAVANPRVASMAIELPGGITIRIELPLSEVQTS